MTNEIISVEPQILNVQRLRTQQFFENPVWLLWKQSFQSSKSICTMYFLEKVFFPPLVGESELTSFISFFTKSCQLMIPVNERSEVRVAVDWICVVS